MGLLQVARLEPPPTFYDDVKWLDRMRRPLSSPVGSIAGWQDERAFDSLRDAYTPFGGIARGDDVGRLLADHGPATFISVANLLQGQEIFGFEWNASLWIPMFQFRSSDLSSRPEVRRVRAELGTDFDGWTVAAWFVEPNVWLGHRRPIQQLDSDLDGILHAARADRFVASG